MVERECELAAGRKGEERELIVSRRDERALKRERAVRGNREALVFWNRRAVRHAAGQLDRRYGPLAADL